MAIRNKYSRLGLKGTNSLKDYQTNPGVEAGITMNFLDTDCLIEIIKLLNLKDQISLYQVSNRLREAVTTFWLIKYKHVHIHFLEVVLTEQEFAIFLKSVEPFMESLQLRFLNREKYEILKGYCFERVSDFRFTLCQPYCLQDSDLKDLQQVLPNLKSFSPHGNFTGLYMADWPFLKEINLSFCSKIEMLHFQNILGRLKLEKLKLNVFPISNQFEEMNLAKAQVQHIKYLELNTYELYYFLAKPLNALKELIITNHYNSRQLFDVLLSTWQAKDILLVETANVGNILVNCIEMHMNVEQLTVINDENALPSNIIPSLHLLTDLRKLRFKCCPIKAKDFINLLKNVPQINEISFENCLFDAANISLKIEEIGAKRKEKLRLNMFDNVQMDTTDTPTWRKDMQELFSVTETICVHEKYSPLENITSLFPLNFICHLCFSGCNRGSENAGIDTF